MLARDCRSRCGRLLRILSHPGRVSPASDARAYYEEACAIMNTSALRQTFACLLALAGMALAAPVVHAQTADIPPANLIAESEPIGVYVGATAGLGVSGWSCGGYASCDRTAFSGKLFGGKRLTPTLSAEVNFFEFGQVQRSSNPAYVNAGGNEFERRNTRAIGVGINWEVELLNGFKNQLRAGWVNGRHSEEVVDSTGNLTNPSRNFNSPYIGAGLAFRLTRDVNLVSGVDLILKGEHEPLYLVSLGASTEF